MLNNLKVQSSGVSSPENSSQLSSKCVKKRNSKMRKGSTRSNLTDEQVKLVLKLAKYGTCESGNCDCDSWRSSWPLLEMMKTKDELLRALHQPCLVCHHDVKSHISNFFLRSANLNIKITKNEAYVYTYGLQDANKEHVNFILYRLLRKSFMSALRISSNYEFQQPPFESPTIHEALQTFVDKRFPECDEYSHQLMVNSAKIFSGLLNELILDPSDMQNKHSSVDDATFQLFYGRWFLWCYPDNTPGAPPRLDVTKTMGRTWLKMAFPIFISKIQARKSFTDKLPGAKGIQYLDCFIKFLAALEYDIYSSKSPIWKILSDSDLKPVPILEPSPDLLEDNIGFFGTVEEPVIRKPKIADAKVDYDIISLKVFFVSFMVSILFGICAILICNI